MSNVGSISRLQCNCRTELHYYGPAGGPCEVSRAQLSAEGIIWLKGNQSFREAMSHFSTSIQPWPSLLNDSDLRHHTSTWVSEAARFWGDQGPHVEYLDFWNWLSLFGILVLPKQAYKNAFWKDATGLGAWIETLKNVSTIDHPSRIQYRRIATALDNWHLEGAAQYLSQAGDHQGREVWPSIALLSDALAFHDGVVDAPIDIALLPVNISCRLATTKRFIFKGCIPEEDLVERLLHERHSMSHTRVPHYARVVTVAQHYSGAYFHFLIEALVRVTPLLPELRANSADDTAALLHNNTSQSSRLHLHVSA